MIRLLLVLISVALLACGDSRHDDPMAEPTPEPTRVEEPTPEPTAMASPEPEPTASPQPEPTAAITACCVFDIASVNPRGGSSTDCFVLREGDSATMEEFFDACEEASTRCFTTGTSICHSYFQAGECNLECDVYVDCFPDGRCRPIEAR